MAAQRPERSEERLVSDALTQAFAGPVAAADFQAGLEAVRAAAVIAAEEATADAGLVGTALTSAFAGPIDPDVQTAGAVAVRAAAAAGNVVPLRSRLAHRAGRHAVAAMVAVGSLAGSSGVAAASQSALPGQTLYPVKRAVEQVMLTAAVTPTAEVRMLTRFAGRRLDEAQQLLAGGAGAELVEPLLAEYAQNVAVARELGVDDEEVAVEVAQLEEQADVIREQAIATTDVAGDIDDATVTATPSPQASPDVAVTDVPETAVAKPEGNTSPKEQNTAASAGGGVQAPAPAPATTTSPPKPDSSTTNTGGAAPAPAPTTDPEPEPKPDPDSAGPSPSPSPSPSAPTTGSPSPGTGGKPGPDSGPGSGDGDKPDKPSPSPSPSPSVDPERTPLSDTEPLPDAEAGFLPE